MAEFGDRIKEDPADYYEQGLLNVLRKRQEKSRPNPRKDPAGYHESNLVEGVKAAKPPKEQKKIKIHLLNPRTATPEQVKEFVARLNKDAQVQKTAK